MTICEALRLIRDALNDTALDDYIGAPKRAEQLRDLTERFDEIDEHVGRQVSALLPPTVDDLRDEYGPHAWAMRRSREQRYREAQA